MAFKTVVVFGCFLGSLEGVATASCDCEKQIDDFRKTVDSLRWKLQDLVGIQYKIRSLEREMRLKDERLKDFGKRLIATEKRTQVVKEKHPRNDRVYEGLVGEPVSGILFNINERFSNIDLRLLDLEQDLRNLSRTPSESDILPQLQEVTEKALQNMEQNILLNISKILELDNLQELRRDVDNVTQTLEELKADYEANEAVRKHAQKLRENFMEQIKQSGSPIKLEDLLPTALNLDDDEDNEDDVVHVQITDSDAETDPQEEVKESTLEDFMPEVTDWKEPIT